MTGFAAPFLISHPPIGSLLSQHTMRIPDLQRPYAWTSFQADELCNDLNRLIESIDQGRADPQHFFGTLVVIVNAGQRDDIIDGQQRMTTVTLLLGRIQHAILRLNERCLSIAKANQANKAVMDHHNNVANACQQLSNSVQPLVWVSDGFAANGEQIWKPRIEVSPEIQKTYHSLISGEDGSIKTEISLPARNLRNISRYLDHRIIEPDSFSALQPREQFDYLNKVLMVVRDGLVVVRLGTTAAGAGYELFESLNARGLPLNALDHLKVWMLAAFAELNADSSTVATTMRQLASDDVEDQVHYFEDFYIARTQDTIKRNGITKPKDLVIEARKRIFKDPSLESVPDAMTLDKRIEYEVAYMKRLSPGWFRLRKISDSTTRLPAQFDSNGDKDWIASRLEVLLGSVLKHQAAYPYLMVAADRLKDQPDVFGDLVHVLEKFFFRYKSICGASEHKVVELYNGFLRDLDANPGFNLANVKNKLNLAIAADAPDSLFKTKLVSKLVYSNAAARMRMKYFFEMLDSYSYGPLLKRTGRLQLNDWHLEHIVPQNPAPGDPTLSDEDLNSIGNICLLPPNVNTKLSNKNYADKQIEANRLRSLTGKDQVNIGIADPSNIFYNGHGPVWSPSDVAARITALENFACQVFTV